MKTEQLHTKEAEARAEALRQAAKDPKALFEFMDLPQTGKDRAMVIDLIAEMPISYRATYARAMRGKSRATAIKAHCEMCMGWHRNDVPQCTAPDCPLYPYRPGG